MKTNKVFKIVLITMLWVELSVAWSIVHAQENAHQYPVIGQKCPPFTLHNLIDYPQKTINSTELLGKYVILDFWHQHCLSCIENFPKMNALYEKYKGKVELFYVGLESNKGDIKSFYQGIKERDNLKLPMTFDAELYRNFVAGMAAPHIILIDDKGVVKAITASITEKLLINFLEGNELLYKDQSFLAYKLNKESYDYRIPYLINGNGRTDVNLEYRSLIIDAEKNVNSLPVMVFSFRIENEIRDKKRIEGNHSIKALFRFAYLGYWYDNMDDPKYEEFYPNIFFKVDSGLVIFDEFLKRKFHYSLIVPARMQNIRDMQTIMQSDLKNFFGYKGEVVDMEMPYWEIQFDTIKLNQMRTKGGPWRGLKNDELSYNYYNHPIDEIIWQAFRLTAKNTYPILNYTGFHSNVDLIDLPIFTGLNFENVRKILGGFGIHLVLKKRNFKVLILHN